ncbi:MAG: hypothetical protein C0459_06575 [Chitinophaga sp.]|jgi:Ni/Co efflux regulator RcnB|nr:hypothetical protein [Chitinophaga sp.]
MKRIILILIATAITATSFAQKQTEAKEEKEKKSITPPAAVKAAFEKAFKGATKTKWGKEKDGSFEASFTQSGKEMSATYDAAGNLKETEWEIKVSELPASVTDYVKKNYKGKKIDEAAKILKANGEVNFEAEVGGKDILFDANGKFISEAKD